ncbi:hypothetical protein C7I87_31625 [Mesorhizobium sp. SARCC-RB16n]|uniref:hypothetical protein n=1 Tax=Mesorhizobium sp. SARCC-RB16n TaxID=2116687 RepID=UPI00122F6E0D|nr:hypothetical protein [Mesorhizobium sp. SARCC-RB16n]KAA3445840.1 hypothetical protein C7I87_31625 [Mesorhizobium sp. SARCC-RB16n]
MPSVIPDGDLKSIVGQHEALVLKAWLREVNWNQSQAERNLKVSRRHDRQEAQPLWHQASWIFAAHSSEKTWKAEFLRRAAAVGWKRMFQWARRWERGFVVVACRSALISASHP